MVGAIHEEEADVVLGLLVPCESRAEKALGKLKAALRTEQLAAELILLDPKEKPSEENPWKIADFCARLQGEEKTP